MGTKVTFVGKRGLHHRGHKSYILGGTKVTFFEDRNAIPAGPIITFDGTGAIMPSHGRLAPIAGLAQTLRHPFESERGVYRKSPEYVFALC